MALGAVVVEAIKGRAKRSWLVKCPPPLLAMILRRRPYLLDALPPGFVVRWPYYLGDVSVCVEPGNAIEREMLSGVYDAESMRIIRHFVRPGDTCIDVGANVGPITLLLAKLVGPGGRVVAFEPGPPYCAKLRRNLRMNPALATVVTVVDTGLSDRSGTRRWRVDPDHPYNAGLLQDDPAGISVPIEPLDRSLERLGLRAVRFIKIDVEGMELEVLRGSSATLRRLRPVILFETMDVFRAERGFDIFADIETVLASVGYRMCNLGSDGVLIDVSSRNLPHNTIGIPVEG